MTAPRLLLGVSRPSRQVFSYNPELLVSDYVFRTQADVPGGTFWEPGAQLVKNLSAEKARDLLTSALSQDPTTFMAALEKRN